MKVSKKIKDERIVQLNNKIQSEAFTLVIILLAVSIFIKTYAMNLPTSSCIAELTILIIAAIYTTVRSYLVGYSSTASIKNNKKLATISILGLSTISTAAIAIRNYTLYSENYNGIFDLAFIAAVVISFISSTILIAVTWGIIVGIEQLGQRRIEKQLENDED